MVGFLCNSVSRDPIGLNRTIGSVVRLVHLGNLTFPLKHIRRPKPTDETLKQGRNLDIGKLYSTSLHSWYTIWTEREREKRREAQRRAHVWFNTWSTLIGRSTVKIHCFIDEYFNH